MGFEVRLLRRYPLTRVRIAAGPLTSFYLSPPSCESDGFFFSLSLLETHHTILPWSQAVNLESLTIDEREQRTLPMVAKLKSWYIRRFVSFLYDFYPLRHVVLRRCLKSSQALKRCPCLVVLPLLKQHDSTLALDKARNPKSKSHGT